ncbi:MAG: ABC transporter ATP-binding protein [Xanthobacteraceae bacterium]|nr:ABC transporter ATP-binding protein [Xanthobacteraceae bacterium]
MPALKLEDLRVLVAGKPVVDGLSLTVAPSEIVALIGAPGCGKSTLMRAIFGLVHPAAGRIVYNDKALASHSPLQSIANGVVLVPQGGRVFRTLSVEQNLELAGYTLDVQRIKARTSMIYEIFPRLAERRRQIAGSLSGGERQMLALAMGIFTEPRLLLLDEPSTGLSPIMTTRMLETIKTLSAELQCSVLLVEQNVRNAVQISDRVLVMDRGRISHAHDVIDRRDLAPLLDAYAFTRSVDAPTT